MIGLLTDWQSWLLTAAGVVAVLALLYLLKPQRRRIEVPFGGLWQQVLASAEARALGRRWRRPLSFLLMAATALLLAGALGEPLIGLRGCSAVPVARSSHTLVIVDNSASMATLDGQRHGGRVRLDAPPFSRLDEARERVAELVTAALPGERFLLMTAAGRQRTRCGWSSDPTVLQQAIAGLRAGQGGLDLRRAWAVAGDALKGLPQARVVLISDGGTPMIAGPQPKGIVTQTIQVGPAPRLLQAGFANLAVEQVGIRPAPGDPARGLLSVRVRNDRDEATQVRVAVSASAAGQGPADFATEGAQRDVRTQSIPARASQWLHFDGQDLDESRFAVHVQPLEGAQWRDLAAYDDWGYAVLAQRRQLRVLLVGQGNLFLEAALLSNPRVALRKLAVADYLPAHWSAADRSRHGVDLIMLDRVSAAAPVGLPCLRFDPVGHANTLSGAKIVEVPELLLPAGEHPLSRGVSLRDVNVDRVRVLDAPRGSEVLMLARNGGPAAVATTQGTRQIVLGFDLLDTDLGGRYALPILIGNSVDWLAGEEEPLLAPLDVGRIWAIELPTREVRWRHRRPDGRVSAARVAGDQVIGSSEQHGIHQWVATDGTTIARSTRLPATERPGDRQALSGPWQPPAAAEQARNQPAPLEIWLWLLALAALVLLVEWPLYLRRKTL